MLAFALAALTLAALLPVLLPLLRGAARPPDREAFDRAVYRDQLAELDRDIERGLLTASESGGARLEIQRRLLAAAPDSGTPRLGKSRILATALGIGTALGAVGLYLTLGVPVMPALTGPAAGIARAATELAQRLRDNPNDAESWLMYGRAMGQLERWDDAETAWRRAMALGRASPDVVASLGEILVMRDRGAVGAEARGLFDMALRGDATNPVARYYMALGTAQSGAPKEAIAQFQALLDDLPPDSPQREDVARRIQDTARAAGLPVPSSSDRAAAIEGMVAKLAARLEREPSDAEGWARLGRSHAVLGRAEAAADAYEKSAALTNDPASRLAAAEALLSGLKPEDAIPPRAMALLRQVEAARPDEPAVLWYLGLAAARDRQAEAARSYWSRLGSILPPDSDDARMVRAAIEALAGTKAP